MKRYRPDVLRAYAGALLVGGGFEIEHARRTAEVLVWANLRGAESHGVLRIPRYVEMVELGIIDPVAEPKVVKRDGVVAVLEAAKAPGASAMGAAMNEAIAIATSNGIGWCAVRGITHAGAVGFYTLPAVQSGLIGIVMTASGPLMAYHGSRTAGVSTNPIAIGVPGPGNPVLLDMSTSTVALGKVMAAKDAGTPIPDNWGLDAEGHPTTDPTAIRTLTPLGGPKGSGLSLMIEILSSVLVGNPVIATALEGGRAGMNGVAMAIRVSAFGDAPSFHAEIARLERAIHSLPQAPGTTAIHLPGERGFAMAAEREKSGIPLAAGTISRLAALGDRLGVAFDEMADGEGVMTVAEG